MSAVFTVISAMMALAGTVLIFLFILPDKKRAQLPSFFKFLHDLFNFKGLMLETIMKALYILTTLFVVINGFFSMFAQSYYWGPSVILRGFLTMLLGPVVVRLAFELIMMFILLVKNVIAINSKLSQDGADDHDVFKPHFQPTAAKPEATVEAAPVCPACGAPLAEGHLFCAACGQKL